jgi:hypothetical protein
MVSKESASSRNSSLRPSSRIRWDSDPFAASRVALVMRVSGASMLPARSHPPTRPKISSAASMTATLGRNATTRSLRSGKFGQSPPAPGWPLMPTSGT